MAEEALKSKVRTALGTAFEDDPNVEISLEDVPPDRIAGLVLSETLAKMSPSERQDYIWKFLDDALSPVERTRISFIVTDTPDEYKVLTGSG
jgi:hypothetical protein